MIKIKTIELNNRNNSLNLLRLIFATTVILWHSIIFVGFEQTLPDFINFILCLAVPSFFVVSGYLITASAIKNPLKIYFKKRIARIYPGYFSSLVIVPLVFAPIAYMINFNGFDLSGYLSLNPSPLNYILSGLFLMLEQATIGDLLINLRFVCWNTSVWTLIYEFGCYIVIAVVISILKKLKKEKFTEVIIAIYILLIILSLFHLRVDKVDPNMSRMAIIIANTANLASMFFGGSIVYLIKDKITFNRKFLSLAIIFCIIVMSILPYGWSTEICAIPLLYIILYAAVTIKSPKFIMKNDISYGMYIYSWPVQATIFCYFLKQGINCPILLFFIISAGITAVIALLSWFLIEKPCLDKVN